MTRRPAPAAGADLFGAYHALLEDQDLADGSIEALREGQRERKLVFGDHPVCVSLRPQLLSRTRFDHAVGAAKGVFGALRTLERALLRDPDLRAELDLDPQEERLALADPGCKESSPSARIDGFFQDDLRFVEYNAESPAGMAYSDNLAEVFERLPVMRAFRRRFRMRRRSLAPRQVSAMLQAFRQWGKARTPAVAIVDWHGLPTLTEFEMFVDALGREGVRAWICEPAELEYRRGRLWAAGHPVNLIYRRVLTTELLAREEEAKALTEAYLDGSACVVNTFRAKLLHKKMSLALLSDERYARLYTAGQRAAIARHIPWTRKVRHGPTEHRGRRVPDLVEYVARGRERLVLKPNDEYGGKGVLLGWDVDQHEWEDALTVALSRSYVVQEAVPIPREPFPLALDGIEFIDLAMDLDPFVFGGAVPGSMTRLSSSALLNVTAGAGSLVPTYTVDGPA